MKIQVGIITVSDRAAAGEYENLGGPGWHRELWDGFLGRSDFSVVTDLDAILAEHGSSFSSEYGLFIERAHYYCTNRKKTPPKIKTDSGYVLCWLYE
jgi:hypothetical protein